MSKNYLHLRVCLKILIKKIVYLKHNLKCNMNIMKKIFLITLFLISYNEYICARSTKSESKIYTDSMAMSILEEAIIIYRHETSKNIAYDAITEYSDSYNDFIAVMNDKETEILYYEIKNDTIKIKSSVKVYNVYGNRTSLNIAERLATPNEQKLITAREAVKNFVETSVNMHVPEQCRLSLVIIDKETYIRSYILTEPDHEADVIPLGNDYTCVIKDNEVKEFNKLHETYLPIEYSEDRLICSATHSHLKDNPYITPTEISTLLIYGQQIGMKSFGVYSPHGKYHSYLNIDTGKLRLVDDKVFFKLMKKD